MRNDMVKNNIFKKLYEHLFILFFLMLFSQIDYIVENIYHTEVHIIFNYFGFMFTLILVIFIDNKRYIRNPKRLIKIRKWSYLLLFYIIMSSILVFLYSKYAIIIYVFIVIIIASTAMLKYRYDKRKERMIQDYKDHSLVCPSCAIINVPPNVGEIFNCKKCGFEMKSGHVDH